MTSENPPVASLHAQRTRRLLAGASNAALAACLTNWTAGARRVAPVILALLTLVGAKAAVAQQTSSDIPPIVDYGAGTASAAYNVNGQLAFTTTDLSIGPADAGGLVSQQNYIGQGRGWRSNFSGTITNDTYGNFTVSFGPHSESFAYSSGTRTYTPVQASGSSLVLTSTGWNYTTGDGTVYAYDSSYWTSKPISPLVNTSDAQLVQIVTPAGDVTNMTYSAQSGSNSKGNYQTVRLQSVVNNHGYVLAFQYSTAPSSFNVLQTVTGINLAIDYCAPTANGCSGFTVTWPKVTYSTDGSGNSLVTDALGNTTTYGFDTVSPYGINAITLPGSARNNYSFTYFNYGGAGGPRQISTMVDVDGTYTNTYSTDGSGNSIVTQTDPLGHTHSKYVDVYQVEVKSADGTGAISTRTDNYTGQILSSSTPEGVVTSYVYDSRGNVKSTTITPKSGSGLSPIITSATFPATCTYVATCNKPSATFDALGNETDYTYDNTHGVTLSVTQPAPTSGAARPQVNSSYTNIYAAYKQSSGGAVTAAPSPIYELTQTNLCNTGVSCSGASNQTVTTFAFATNNLAPTSTTTAAGNGSVSAATQSAYDSIANVISTTDPLGNATVYRYDADRRKIGFVGPLPGVSGLSNRASKSTYNSLGEVTLVQQGTDTQSDTNWSSFSVLSQSSTAYDSLGRKIQDSQLDASGSVISTTQYSYDAAGRLQCSTVRMNPSTFSGLPAACTAATSGSYGADRISLTSYDNANRLTQTIVAYGTPANAAIVNNTYGADGELTTQADAKGNLTSYVIDGFDRVSQIRFPTPSNGSVSSTTDYEQNTYDANGSITQDRRRDGSTITNAYDALKRLSQEVGGSINRTFTYDNVGRMTNAVDNTTGLQVTLSYDALGRKLTDNQAGTTVTSAFDAAGRRTALTFPDGYQVTYGYDSADDLTSINDTSSAFVSYNYDNLGRQTVIGRNLGPTTSYGYGSDLRLSSLGHVFADSGKNLTLGYTYNPAGQQTATTSSNRLYWGSSPTASASYGVDGQNKYTTVGPASFSYDARANLKYEGSASRTYDTANELGHRPIKGIPESTPG